MTGAVNFGWTAEHVATLRRMIADGSSAGQVAAALGDLSRCAVLGKARRLGLTFDGDRAVRLMRAKIVSMVVERKMLTEEIARELGVSYEGARERIKAVRKLGMISATALRDNYMARAKELRAKQEVNRPKAVKAKPVAAAKSKPTAKPKTDAVPAAAPTPAEIATSCALVTTRNPFAAVAGFGVSLFDLPAPELQSACRWPFLCDDGETRYCGRVATDGSWCRDHARLAYAGDARPTMAAYAPIKAGRGLSMQREAR